MNALAIVEAATAEGLVVELSLNGSLKAVGEQEVVDRWRPLLKQHKAEIVILLSGVNLPNWCRADCDHYHRLEVPDVGTMQWCCQDDDYRHWRIARINRLSHCPLKMEAR